MTPGEVRELVAPERLSRACGSGKLGKEQVASRLIHYQVALERNNDLLFNCSHIQSCSLAFLLKF